MNELPRSEYPRPDFVREDWLSLNGAWDFSFDTKTYDKTILVPYAPETVLSGIHDAGFHKAAWYRKVFALPQSMEGKRILLHFGAVDYRCRVWVNGAFQAEHIGGQTGFSVDITEVVHKAGENVIELCAKDDHRNLEIPRGKQYWEPTGKGIFYSRTTGIWQSVWLEAVNEVYLEKCHITPLFDQRSVQFEYRLNKAADVRLEAAIDYQGQRVACVSHTAFSRKGSFSVQLDQQAMQAWNFCEDLTWSPETPRLFDVTFRLCGSEGVYDTVQSYFGMRKVSVENGVFMLNNRPYYQKLILDQGYWPDSLLTAPEDGAFIRDIELIKAMGFNGVRKHQKAEDPRFLYHADRMGLLVWGEIGSAYIYSREYAHSMYQEWQDVIERDYNHPCIIAWTPLNESWGIQEISYDKRQQAHSAALYYLTKSIDQSRLVIDNDGWEHTCGDLLTIHDYASAGEELARHFCGMETILHLHPGGRRLFADGWEYSGQPVLVTEFGGVRYAPGSTTEHAWGYCEVNEQNAFIQKYADLIQALRDSECVQGFCYTQLTDIETEENGLLYYDRRPKVPLEVIRTINEGRYNAQVQ
jgi:beta-galactosidase/beta-glucuronidase